LKQICGKEFYIRAKEELGEHSIGSSRGFQEYKSVSDFSLSKLELNHLRVEDQSQTTVFLISPVSLFLKI
jgi:hypothetical protein